MEDLKFDESGEPRLPQTYTLSLMGDWGSANFHRICSWLTQEFCDRAGPGSYTTIRSFRDGGMDALNSLQDGTVDLAIATPAGLMGQALKGEGMFQSAMPRLRAIGTLPQNDRMVLAIGPKYNINNFQELRRQRPALRLATSTNDGTNFIGYVANQFLNAHDVSKATIESWGGKVLTRHRPEQCIALVQTGEADALLQEAIMTPGWKSVVEANKVVPIPAEAEALEHLHKNLGLGPNNLPVGWWSSASQAIPALDFSDFVVFVRDDMPKKVAYLLTWCLVETRLSIERSYRHIPSERSPLGWPMIPTKMAQTPVPLHDGAKEYYSKADLHAPGKPPVGAPV